MGRPEIVVNDGVRSGDLAMAGPATSRSQRAFLPSWAVSGVDDFMSLDYTGLTSREPAIGSKVAPRVGWTAGDPERLTWQPTTSIFGAMLQEFDGAARLLGLDPGIWKMLTTPQAANHRLVPRR